MTFYTYRYNYSLSWKIQTSLLSNFIPEAFCCKISQNTVQLRYKRTTHTHIVRVYFAYTRMSVRAHIRVYTHVYVSLLCIPISFFMWSIVSQTKNIFLGNENASKRNLHIVKTSSRSVKAIIFQVLNHFTNSLWQTTVY